MPLPSLSSFQTPPQTNRHTHSPRPLTSFHLLFPMQITSRRMVCKEDRHRAGYSENIGKPTRNARLTTLGTIPRSIVVLSPIEMGHQLCKDHDHVRQGPALPYLIVDARWPPVYIPTYSILPFRHILAGTNRHLVRIMTGPLEAVVCRTAATERSTQSKLHSPLSSKRC